MANREDIRWFKDEFGAAVSSAVTGTPLTLDFFAALACQESGEVWPALRRQGVARDELLGLCVGDTLDADKGRTAFPKTKADLVAAPNGAAMFAVARQALVDMAAHIPQYAGAASRPNKFCHGFGMFQRDLQFFLEDPQYFLSRSYERFENTLDQALGELKKGLRKLGFEGRTALSDIELAAVGIVYNTGQYKPEKGLFQGHLSGSKYYGVALFDYLRLAHTVPSGSSPSSIAVSSTGLAALTAPSKVTGLGALMQVSVDEGTLRVRSEPLVTEPPQQNVLGHLPDGHIVHVPSRTGKNGFLQVETNLRGALLKGYASRKYLRMAAADAEVEEFARMTGMPRTIPAVQMPSKHGLVTRRREFATARSLNEANQPGRSGETAEELRAELHAIIEWLDSENAQHLRYLPRDGLTFCNIYAHDYCHLSRVYLPRVWWTGAALVAIAQGKNVEVHLGSTISEMNANALFAWLRDFGLSFGWRQSGTLTELQTEVNQGAVGVIVSLRKESRRPGHIAIAVPETIEHQARRTASGEVVAPLQSQAGAKNFRYGTGQKNWWRGEQFADFAFWLHA